MAYVIDYLQGRGAAFTVVPRRATEASPNAAIPDELVARTVVVMASSGPALMVIPAVRELDLELAREAVGDPQARLATDAELERQFPDYEPGALPPLAMMLLAPTYVDPVVAEGEEIAFAAGRLDVSIRMATRDVFGNDPIVIRPLTGQLAAPAS
ncbi:MAG TPA: YbaK/EbsC family protein [Actinomycetota bacterium]